MKELTSCQMLLLVLMTMMVFSCGSRKVNLHTKSINEEVKAEELEEVKSKVIELSKEHYSNLVQKLNVRADSIKTDSKGNTTLYNPVIAKEENKYQSDVDTSKLSETNSYKAKNEESSKSEDEKTKDVDKKQFNLWNSVIPIGLIVLFLVFVLWKWAVPFLKNKLKSITN